MKTERIASWVLGVLLGLVYVYLVVAAVGNVIGIVEMSGLLGLELGAIGWFWLVLGVALPVAAFVVALLIGRGRRAGARLLVLAAGIAAVAAIQLEVMHLVPQSSFFA
ncbi:MAG: hypothetical protein AB7V10_03410 [Leucobacter sp.]